MQIQPHTFLPECRKTLTGIASCCVEECALPCVVGTNDVAIMCFQDLVEPCHYTDDRNVQKGCLCIGCCTIAAALTILLRPGGVLVAAIATGTELVSVLFGSINLELAVKDARRNRANVIHAAIMQQQQLLDEELLNYSGSRESTNSKQMT